MYILSFQVYNSKDYRMLPLKLKFMLPFVNTSDLLSQFIRNEATLPVIFLSSKGKPSFKAIGSRSFLKTNI
jgi:hypothetical protein